MITSSNWVYAVVVIVFFLMAARTNLATDKTTPPPPEVKESPQEKQARGYQELFEKVGLSGLSERTNDRDTGLALQASWELHKKLVKRDKRPFLPAGTYDSAEVKKFLTFLNDRTKTPVPDWWTEAISDLYVEQGHYHRCVGTEPKRKQIDLGKTKWLVSEGAELTLHGDVCAYKSDGVSLEYPREFFDGFDTLADASGGKIACLAAYTSYSGNRFPVGGFENKGGKRLWKADVWAVNRRLLLGAGARHRVELTTKGDTVFVFGAETGGLYLEAFDLKTGKNQFRFCTSYWGNYSEKWNLKPSD